MNSFKNLLQNSKGISSSKCMHKITILDSSLAVGSFIYLLRIYDMNPQHAIVWIMKDS